jgi:hypothetical protein
MILAQQAAVTATTSAAANVTKRLSARRRLTFNLRWTMIASLRSALLSTGTVRQARRSVVMRTHRRAFVSLATLGCSFLIAGASNAQLSAQTQTPNAAMEGMFKSVEEETGACQGDVNMPDSSIFIIQRDPFRSIRRDRQIFQRKFRVAQAFAPGTGDGFGTPGNDPDIFEDASVVAGLADSCVACHGRPRGACAGC